MSWKKKSSSCADSVEPVRDSLPFHWSAERNLTMPLMKDKLLVGSLSSSASSSSAVVLVPAHLGPDGDQNLSVPKCLKWLHQSWTTVQVQECVF